MYVQMPLSRRYQRVGRKRAAPGALHPEPLGVFLQTTWRKYRACFLRGVDCLIGVRHAGDREREASFCSGFLSFVVLWTYIHPFTWTLAQIRKT